MYHLAIQEWFGPLIFEFHLSIDNIFKFPSLRVFFSLWIQSIPLQEPRSKTIILLWFYWRCMYSLVSLIICNALFTWKSSSRAAFQVMRYYLFTTKIVAETLKHNMDLILFPVCRNTITWLCKNYKIIFSFFIYIWYWL